MDSPYENAPDAAEGSIETLVLVHVACGAAATLLFLPLGVLIPRYGRALTRGRWWFPTHMAVQLIGTILAIVAIATGNNLGGAEGASHSGVAWVFLAGIAVQIIVGIFIHWYKGRFNRVVAKSGRGPFHFVHIGIGLLVILVGWATALTGYFQEWSGENDAGVGHFMTGWKILIGVFIGVFGLAYIIGVIALPAANRHNGMGDKTPESLIEMPKREVGHSAVA